MARQASALACSRLPSSALVDPPENQMTRAARIAVCLVASLSMTGTLTGVAVNAWAAPIDRHGQHQHHRHLQHDGSPHVLLALGRLDRQLTRSIRHRLSPLTDADRAIIRAHAATDQATVEAVAAAYSRQPSDHHLDTARGLLHSYHPERYYRGTGMLRRANHAAQAIVRLEQRVVPGGSAQADLTRAAELLARVRARTFSARTPSGEMARARYAVQQARSLVQRVREGLPKR
jgi:hypothetical protein